MKLLLVDTSSESQTLLADYISRIPTRDKDALNITFNLASDYNFEERVRDVDVMVLGAGSIDSARNIAARAKSANPTIQLLQFVTTDAYDTHVFRSAQHAGIRKVFHEFAPVLDFLQELCVIQTELRGAGKFRLGNLIVVFQGKGGVGATSICAALAEACDEAKKKTLLWDLDIESFDLARALNAKRLNTELLGSWVREEGRPELNNFSQALCRLSPYVDALIPPSDFGEALELISSPSALPLVERIGDIAKTEYDVVIVDLGGRLSPSTLTLMNIADTILTVVDDSELGLSALYQQLLTVDTQLKTLDRIRFVASGTAGSLRQIEDYLSKSLKFSKNAWNLPSVPFDNAASSWPGSGKTLYSVGSRYTRDSFSDIASSLGLLGSRDSRPFGGANTATKGKIFEVQYGDKAATQGEGAFGAASPLVHSVSNA